MNNIEFYTITNSENGNGKLKNGTNFKSTHYFSDMALLRGAKFYNKKKLNDLQNNLRQ